MYTIRNSLNLVTFNVGSLVNIARKLELNVILDQGNADIAFLQELHLPEGNNIYLDNFIVLRDKSSVGVGIVIKKTISYSKISIPDLKFYFYSIKFLFICRNQCFDEWNSSKTFVWVCLLPKQF